MRFKLFVMCLVAAGCGEVERYGEGGDVLTQAKVLGKTLVQLPVGDTVGPTEGWTVGLASLTISVASSARDARIGSGDWRHYEVPVEPVAESASPLAWDGSALSMAWVSDDTSTRSLVDLSYADVHGEPVVDGTLKMSTRDDDAEFFARATIEGAVLGDDGCLSAGIVRIAYAVVGDDPTVELPYAEGRLQITYAGCDDVVVTSE